MQAAANPRHGSELTLELARCARQLVPHCCKAAQRAAIDRAVAFAPGHDHLVADIIEDFAAIVHDGEGKETKGAIEQTVNGDAAETLGEPGRSCDVDKQHEAVFLDRRMIPPGDEVQERARPDDVGDPDNEIRQNHESDGIGIDVQKRCETDRGSPAMTSPNWKNWTGTMIAA